MTQRERKESWDVIQTAGDIVTITVPSRRIKIDFDDGTGYPLAKRKIN